MPVAPFYTHFLGVHDRISTPATAHSVVYIFINLCHIKDPLIKIKSYQVH